MGHLLGVIDQARLDEQRGVVQNEKRQGENEPYGQVFPLIFENAFPAGHPYSWSVIGSMEDLNAAALKDVKEWFQKYYGPSNAVIVLAGDIDLKTAREKIEKNFGRIVGAAVSLPATSGNGPQSGIRTNESREDRIAVANLSGLERSPGRSFGERPIGVAGEHPGRREDLPFVLNAWRTRTNRRRTRMLLCMGWRSPDCLRCK